MRSWPPWCANETATARIRPYRRLLDPIYWGEVLLTSDPDRARWRMAAQATLSTAGTAAIVWGVKQWIPHAPSTMLVGVILAMTVTMAVSDATVSAQCRTIALLPIPAALCLTIGTLLSPHPWANHVMFLATILGAVWLRRFGPRGLALGMVGYFSYF